jgi:hypothetical protein
MMVVAPYLKVVRPAPPPVCVCVRACFAPPLFLLCSLHVQGAEESQQWPSPEGACRNHSGALAQASTRIRTLKPVAFHQHS